jgi:hypothetical protein
MRKGWESLDEKGMGKAQGMGKGWEGLAQPLKRKVRIHHYVDSENLDGQKV